MTDAAPKDSEVQEHRFQADVNQVLDIVIHSLYSHPEIFLRELISNASDAIDKLRFRALTDHDLVGEDKEFAIEIRQDQEAKTITISDNGIGMTESEMVEFLGTVAQSGSKRFIEALKQKGQGGDEVDFIGQFGVGFYSAFLVADRVTVRSLAAGEKVAHCWESEAQGSFTMASAEKASRGTEIELHLKDDQHEFLEEFKVRELVRRYSDFVGHPIKLEVTREEGEEDDKKTVISLETINTASALWKRPKNEIDDEQYEEFYKHLTHDWEKPLARTHFSVEGTQLFTGLLFIPKRPPFDLYDRNKRRGVRLYVKRVFIMDECEQLLPEWLRFVRGIIDSDDLPLNVSRELLQEDRVVRAIRKQIIKKVLDVLSEMASERSEDYIEFWKSFGPVLKEGLHFDPDRKEELAKLLRFDSSKKDLTSLEDYVSRMKEDQESIYYIIGPTRTAVEGSPHIESLTAKGYEVLYMTDTIDEWAVEGLQEFEGKKLVSAMKSDLELDSKEDESDESKEEKDNDLSGLTERVRVILQEQVSEVRVSKRLTDSPCCLVVPEGGMHAHIERMLRAQNQEMPATKRIFELNPNHPVITRLKDVGDREGQSQEMVDWVELLYDQALLAEGSPIADPQKFARRMGKLMSKAIGGAATAATDATEAKDAEVVTDDNTDEKEASAE